MKIASIIFIILVLFTAFMLSQSKTSQQPEITSGKILSPNPSPLAKTDEVISIDGTKKLVMKIEDRGAGTTFYSFYVADGQGKNQKLIFTRLEEPNSKALLPANSWSPDAKYIFINEIKDGITSYLVLKASGGNFTSGKFLDVSSLFTEKRIPYKLTEITGWDAPGLLHIKTTGSNYWFEIDSLSFIQLAR